MNVLYLDTTTTYLYAGIVSEHQLKAEVKEKLERDLSTMALPRISELFAKAKMQPEEIDKILVVRGPGSFTGIRIGVTIAKVYAWSQKKEISTISSLEAMAISSKRTSDYKVAVIDARRDSFFAGVFDSEGNPVLAEQYITRENLLNRISELKSDKSLVWISNQSLKEIDDQEMYDPDILSIVEKYRNRTSVNPHAVNPEYLKLTEAEETRQVNCS